jgi:hypothetical protein
MMALNTCCQPSWPNVTLIGAQNWRRAVFDGCFATARRPSDGITTFGRNISSRGPLTARFLRALVAAHEPRFMGWQLPNIHREIEEPAAEPKGFPFKLEEVLPWWGGTEESQDGKTTC